MKVEPKPGLNHTRNVQSLSIIGAQKLLQSTEERSASKSASSICESSEYVVEIIKPQWKNEQEAEINSSRERIQKALNKSNKKIKSTRDKSKSKESPGTKVHEK